MSIVDDGSATAPTVASAADAGPGRRAAIRDPHRATVAGRRSAPAERRADSGGDPARPDVPAPNRYPESPGTGTGGASTAGSGWHLDGGACAIVPGMAGGGQMDAHRLSRATSAVFAGRCGGDTAVTPD